MSRTETQKTAYMITGMLLAVSISFILFFIEPHFPGFLRYGYLKKLILWTWLLLLYLYAIKVEEQKFLLWVDKKRNILFYILSVISILGLVALAGAVQHFLPRSGLKIQTSQVLKEMMDYMHTHPLLLLLTCVTAAVVEELIFRGYLIPRLHLLFRNNYLPVIISALVFGAAHIGYGTLQNMVVPFLIGLIFGAFYRKYRNLKVLILCHFIIDLLSLTL